MTKTEYQMKIDFKEEQKFTQWWLWIFLIGIGILPLFGIYKQLIIGEKFGDKPMSDFGLILFCLFTFSIIAMFWFIKLKTEIDQNEIRIIFFPFLKKQVNWKEIKSAEIVKYGFVGYGIRFWTKYGTVYNTKGNKGLAIELLDGTKFLIGTQLETQLDLVVKKIKE
jgi:hypothetical protein